MQIYSVIITHYEDDYKSRGDDWSNSEKPVAFSTMKLAREYLCRYLVDHIQDSSNEKFIKNNRYAMTSSGKVKKDYRQHLPTLEELIAPLIEGEYVNCKMDWSIDTIEVDKYISQEKDTEEESEEDEEESEEDDEEAKSEEDDEEAKSEESGDDEEEKSTDDEKSGEDNQVLILNGGITKQFSI